MNAKSIASGLGALSHKAFKGHLTVTPRTQKSDKASFTLSRTTPMSDRRLAGLVRGYCKKEHLAVTIVGDLMYVVRSRREQFLVCISNSTRHDGQVWASVEYMCPVH